MVMRGKIVRLSLLCEINGADAGFHICFQYFRSADLSKVTKKCLNALSLNLSYMWAWSFLFCLGFFSRFFRSIVFQAFRTQSIATINLRFFCIFPGVTFLRLVYFIQYLNTFVRISFVLSNFSSVSLLHFAS